MTSVDIDSLPDEVIGLIFRLLTKRDRESLSLANKRFFEIYKRKAGLKFIFNLSHRRVGRYGQQLSDICRIFRYRSTYKYDQLTIRSTVDIGKLNLCLKENLEGVPLNSVRYLVLDGCRMKLPELLELVKLFPRLEGIGVIGYFFGANVMYDWLKSSPLVVDYIAVSVRKLVIATDYRFPTEYFSGLLDLFPKLNTLRTVLFGDWSQFDSIGMFDGCLAELEKKKMEVKVSSQVRYAQCFTHGDMGDLLDGKPVDKKIREHTVSTS